MELLFTSTARLLWRAWLGSTWGIGDFFEDGRIVLVFSRTNMDRRRSEHGYSSTLEIPTKQIPRHRSFPAFGAEDDVRIPQWSIPSTEGFIDSQLDYADGYAESDDDDDDVFAFTESKSFILTMNSWTAS